MALDTPVTVVEDTPSEVVRELRLQFNALLDAFAAIVDASQLTDFAAFKAAAEDAEVDLQKVEVYLERPAPPKPTY